MLPGMIGTIDPRHKKFELDWIDAALYRLRIRERTAIERKLRSSGSALSWVSPSLQDFVVQSPCCLLDFLQLARDYQSVTHAFETGASKHDKTSRRALSAPVVLIGDSVGRCRPHSSQRIVGRTFGALFCRRRTQA
jgi:hypothetical protein